MCAKLVTNVSDITNLIENEKKFILFYFRGAEQKNVDGIKRLRDSMTLATKYLIPARQWNTKDGAKDYFVDKYGVNDDIGFIMFRDGEYLTAIRELRNDSDEKLKKFEEVLKRYSSWPVRPSPKQHLKDWKLDQVVKNADRASAAKKNEQAKKNARREKRKKIPKKMLEKVESECCVIL